MWQLRKADLFRHGQEEVLQVVRFHVRTARIPRAEVADLGEFGLALHDRPDSRPEPHLYDMSNTMFTTA